MKLMEQVQNALRTSGYSYKTEQTYLSWIKKYVRFHLPKHPRETGTDGVRAYITHLVVTKNYSPQTKTRRWRPSCFYTEFWALKLAT